jgi:hypothetical protein
MRLYLLRHKLAGQQQQQRLRLQGRLLGNAHDVRQQRLHGLHGGLDDLDRGRDGRLCVPARQRLRACRQRNLRALGLKQNLPGHDHICQPRPLRRHAARLHERARLLGAARRLHVHGQPHRRRPR